MRCCDHAGLTAWMCDDGWLLSLRHEVLHVFLSRVSLMGIYIGHISSNIYTLYRLCLPSPPSADIPVLPREGAISQVALSTHTRLLLGPCSLQGPSFCMLPYGLVLGGLGIGLVYTQTEGLWWGWARGMKPRAGQETQPISAFTGGLPETSRDMRKMQETSSCLSKYMTLGFTR